MVDNNTGSTKMLKMVVLCKSRCGLWRRGYDAMMHKLCEPLLSAVVAGFQVL